MRILPVLIATAGLAGAVALVGITGARLRAPEAPDPASEIRDSVPFQPAPAQQKLTPTSPRPALEAQTELETTAIDPPATVAEAAPQSRAAGASTPRSVAPSIIAVPPVNPQGLERLDARPPLSQIAPAVPPKKPPPKPLLFQPIAEGAGIIVAGGRTITITGVKPIPDGEMCDRQGGGAWPCGRAARSAFRAFLRARAVTCDFPEGEVPDQLSTTCRLGPRDIGAWLAENGWARAEGETYASQAKAAEDAKRGIHGPGPETLPAAANLDTQIPAATPATEAGPADISILPSGAAPLLPGPLPIPDDSLTVLPPGTGVGDPLPAPVSPPARPVQQ